MATGAERDRQLPIGSEIFLDHLAHFVADADAGSRALARAGFAPTPASVQVNPDPAGGAPRLTGTGNVTAMFARGYVEVLFKTADTPLGREFDAAFARHPGIHLAAFSVADAAAAHRRLGASFRVRPLVDMQRPVETASGPDTAAFTIVRHEPGEMPEGRIQVLTHRTEAAVWQPRWLAHPNGAQALLDLVIAVADVEEAAARFARFADRAAVPFVFGRMITLDRGAVVLVPAGAFTTMLPEAPIPSLPFVGAYGVRVASLATAEAVLHRSGIALRRAGNSLVARFPDELGLGAWVFAENASELPWRHSGLTTVSSAGLGPFQDH
jgi:hypothetical protein